MDEIYKRISNEDDWGPDDTQPSLIKQFFTGQTVLLTGCTGFFGKCIVEKLLRGCPNLKKLILLVRPYKEPTQERMKKYFKHLYFDKLLSMYPNILSKVVVVEGDLMSENLNLSDEDRKMIINEVTIIYHNASNVKFEARLSSVLKCNVLGTKYMLELAKDCKKLQSFTYISTAYSHCHNRVIEEKCYSSPADLKMIEDMIYSDEISSNGMTRAAQNTVCQPWPNMYTFSKATAEYLVEEFAKTVPYKCVIYRPSIIVSTYQEPIAAWCGNINGPAATFLGVGLGMIHIGMGDYTVQDYCPADMCTNSLLATTWDTLTHRKDETGKVLVFNYGSSVVNPTSMNKFEEFILPRGREGPSVKMVGPHFSILTQNIFTFILGHIVLHVLPALLGDIILLLTFRKPMALALAYKASQFFRLIYYFGVGNWRVHVTESQKVWDRMSKIDRQLFFCDLRDISWSDFCFNYWWGLRVYILKDPLSTIKAGRLRYCFLQGSLHVIRALAITYIVYYLVSPMFILIKNYIFSVYC